MEREAEDLGVRAPLRTTGELPQQYEGCMCVQDFIKERRRNLLRNNNNNTVFFSQSSECTQFYNYTPNLPTILAYSSIYSPAKLKT